MVEWSFSGGRSGRESIMTKMKFIRAVITVLFPLLLGSCRTAPSRTEVPVPLVSPTPPPATPAPVPSSTPDPVVISFRPARPLEMEILVHSDQTGNDQIYVLDCFSGKKRRLAGSKASDCYASWSPDREKVVFTSDRDGNREIYLVNADGTGLRRVTDNPGPDIFPAWSPDGRSIVFFSGRDGVDNLARYDLADGSIRPLTAFAEGTGGVIAFSPDGGKIFFGYDRMGRYKIFLLDLANGEPKEIITTAIRESRMTALDDPGGLALLYVSGSAEQDDIWLSYVEDGRFLKITSDPAADHSPALSPDGESVVFSSRRNGENWQLYLVGRSGRPVENEVIRITDDNFNYRYPHVK